MGRSDTLRSLHLALLADPRVDSRLLEADEPPKGPPKKPVGLTPVKLLPTGRPLQPTIEKQQQKMAGTRQAGENPWNKTFGHPDDKGRGSGEGLAGKEARTFYCIRHDKELIEKWIKRNAKTHTKEEKAQNVLDSAQSRREADEADEILGGVHRSLKPSAENEKKKRPGWHRVNVLEAYMCPLADVNNPEALYKEGEDADPHFVVMQDQDDLGAQETFAAKKYLMPQRQAVTEDYRDPKDGTWKKRPKMKPKVNMDGSPVMVPRLTKNKQPIIDPVTREPVMVQAMEPEMETVDVQVRCDYRVAPNEIYRGLRGGHTWVGKDKERDDVARAAAVAGATTAFGQVALEGRGGTTKAEAMLPQNRGFAKDHGDKLGPWGNIPVVNGVQQFRNQEAIKELEAFLKRDDIKQTIDAARHRREPLHTRLSPEDLAFIEAAGKDVAKDFHDQIPHEIIAEIRAMEAGEYHWKRVPKLKDVEVVQKRNTEYDEKHKAWEAAVRAVRIQWQQGNRDVEMPPKPEMPADLDPTSSKFLRVGQSKGKTPDINPIEKADRIRDPKNPEDKGDDTCIKVKLTYEKVEKPGGGMRWAPVFTSDDLWYFSFFLPKKIGPPPPKPGEPPSTFPLAWGVKSRPEKTTPKNKSIYDIFKALNWVEGKDVEGMTAEEIAGRHDAAKERLKAMRASKPAAATLTPPVTGGMRATHARGGPLEQAKSMDRVSSTIVNRRGGGDPERSTRPIGQSLTHDEMERDEVDLMDVDGLRDDEVDLDLEDSLLKDDDYDWGRSAQRDAVLTPHE